MNLFFHFFLTKQIHSYESHCGSYKIDISIYFFFLQFLKQYKKDVLVFFIRLHFPIDDLVDMEFSLSIDPAE